MLQPELRLLFAARPVSYGNRSTSRSCRVVFQLLVWGAGPAASRFQLDRARLSVVIRAIVAFVKNVLFMVRIHQAWASRRATADQSARFDHGLGPVVKLGTLRAGFRPQTCPRRLCLLLCPMTGADISVFQYADKWPSRREQRGRGKSWSIAAAERRAALRPCGVCPGNHQNKLWRADNSCFD